MESFTKLRGIVALLDLPNVDTDQIIPKQFLKRIQRTGCGQFLFYDWRFVDGKELNRDFEMNQERYRGAQILVTRANFGCGSSREHAPWALQAGGIRAIISTSFADIFRNNALQNGILPIVVEESVHQSLVDLVEEAPSVTISIDLERQRLLLPGGQEASFPVDSFSKTCLLRGVDELDYLLGCLPAIEAREREREVGGKSREL